MEGDAKQVSCGDSLLLCCLCKNLLRDPVQLHCLRSCCRQCLISTADADNSSHLTCPSCNRVTQACDAEPNAFLERLVQGYAATAETNICAICEENGDADVLALVWCGSCRLSICGDCMPAHNRYNRNHITQSLDELKSLEDSLLKALPPPSCPAHNAPLLFVCFTCEKAKCLTCWAACNKSKHEMSLMNDDKFEVALRNVKSAVSSIKEELLKKSEVFHQCKSALAVVKSARDVHLEEIQKRKRRIVDTVEIVYQEIELTTRTMYDGMELAAENAAAVAVCLEESLNFACDYVQRLVGSNSSCDLWNQQKTVRNHLTSLSSELDKLRTSMDESESICIEPSLPENLECILKSWIGEPQLDAGDASSVPQSQLLRAPSGSIILPHEFYDIVLTQDERVLLAARERGLIELCTRGHTLSQWLPPKQINGKEDDVEAVCALSDGRVAVGVFYAHVIVLLRRNAKNKPASNTWTEDRRIDNLRSPARRLSLHGNTIAVALWKKEPQSWFPGPDLELRSLCSGKQLAALTREYDIENIALTAQSVVTASGQKVMLGDHRNTYVIDAHDRTSDVRLWRFELINDDEVLRGIFPDFSNRVLYVVFQVSEKTSGRVASISLDDGSEQRHCVFNFDDWLLPVCLSLDSGEAVVAALCTNCNIKVETVLSLHSITAL